MKKLVIIASNPNSLISFKGDLIKEFINRNIKVFIFCSDYTVELKKEIIRIGGIPIDIKLNRLGLNIIKEFTIILDLIKKIKSISPDYVLTYFAKPNIYGIISARIAGIKHRFAIIEGLGYPFTKDPNHISIKKFYLRVIISNLYKVSFSLTTKIFLLNNDDLNDLINFRILKSKNKVFVLGPIGISLERYPYNELVLSKEFTFLFIGRLIKEKGIIEYLKSAEIIHKKFPETKFIVLGALENKKNPGFISFNYLNQFLSRKYITWEKDVNVVEWINRCSSFVLPSYREGFPRSTQEAMSIGRSVITTDVPGCRDTVINGKNGFLIPSGNINSLVLAMEFMIQNPNQNKLMGEESHKIAKKLFSNKIFNNRIIYHILD